MLYLVTTRGRQNHGVRHVVIALADEGFYGPELRKYGIELHTLGMRGNRPPVAAVIRLVKLLRALRPDMVMTWLYHADLIGTLAGRLAGVRRIVWNLRCSNFEFSEHPPMTGRVVSLLARLSRLPAAIAANSHAGQVAHEKIGFRPRKWIYLPNGFDTSEWAPDAADRAQMRLELGFSEKDFVVGRIGRVDPQKDLPTFIAAATTAAARNPSMRVVLAGEDTDTLALPDSLRAVTMALGVRRDIPRIMRAIDILVSSSAYGEGLPNVVAEAMASGVPAVVTDVGDSARLVEGSGIVVPVRDPDALARGVEAMAAKSAEERAILGDLARARIVGEYSIETSLRRYADIFDGRGGV